MTSRSALRLNRLDGGGDATTDIPVWCSDREDTQQTIDAMIAEGELDPDDRVRCKYWIDAKPKLPGAHERALDALEQSK